MSAPLVSVIVAVLNGARFLSQAIDSVFSQTWRPFELIVVDGKSTDQSVEIARAYAGVRIAQQSGRGIADAYNLGITLARGELIAFLSHDDLWLPEKLSRQVEHMLACTADDYCIVATQFFLEAGCPFPERVLKRDVLNGTHLLRMMEVLLVRRQVLQSVGLFDTSLSSAEDIDWFARADDCGMQMGRIAAPLLLKRVHDRNTSLTTTEHQQNILRALRHSAARKSQTPGRR